MNSWNRINIGYGSVKGERNCMIKRCKRHDKFLVFIDDGEPMLSRLFGTSCKKHLELVIEKALKYNKERLKKYMAEKLRQRKREARKLLKTT